MAGFCRKCASAVLLAGSLLSGCAAARPPLPPGPVLPEVRFVPPCDPDAVVALTAQDELRLKQRNALLAMRIHELETALLAQEP